MHGLGGLEFFHSKSKIQHSKLPKEVLMAQKKVTKSYLPFIESYCHIHGHFGNKVYRRKRNGQTWVYDYEYKPKRSKRGNAG